MKKKIKILSTLSLTLLLLFSSCEKDLYDEAIQTERNIKISRVSIKDPVVFNNRNLMSEIQKVKEKQTINQATGRIVYDSINNFYFDDENGIKVENGDYDSYTFKVEREAPIDSKLENLVFSKNKEGGFDTFLIKYPYSEEQIKTLSSVEFENMQTEFQILNRTMLIVCYVIKTYGNCTETHSNGVTCSSESVTYDCYSIDSGSGGSTGGGGFGGDFGSGTSGSYSSNEGSPVLTSPNGGHATGNTANPPCTLINKLKKDVEFKNKLASFKNSAATDNFEKYSVIYNDPTPNTTTGQEDTYDYEDFQGAEDAQGGAYTGNSTMQGVIHTHYQGLSSIFSPDDLQDMYNQMIYPDITDDFFIGVVTAQGTAYILQVVDRQAFINFGNQYLSTDKKIENFTDNFYKKKYNLTSSNRANNEKNFLKMMNDLGTGLSLSGTTYMPSATTSPNLFSNLQVKTIDDLTQNVKNTNCN